MCIRSLWWKHYGNVEDYLKMFWNSVVKHPGLLIAYFITLLGTLEVANKYCLPPMNFRDFKIWFVDKTGKQIHMKCQQENHHSDINYHMALNAIFSVVSRTWKHCRQLSTFPFRSKLYRQLKHVNVRIHLTPWDMHTHPSIHPPTHKHTSRSSSIKPFKYYAARRSLFSS